MASKVWKLEWADVNRDLDNLVAIEVTIRDKGYIFRGQSLGVTGKVFQARGAALPPTLRQVGTRLKIDCEEGNRVTRPLSKLKTVGNE